jgi:soluble lytic murein transglycosylase-like protein
MISRPRVLPLLLAAVIGPSLVHAAKPAGVFVAEDDAALVLSDRSWLPGAQLLVRGGDAEGPAAARQLPAFDAIVSGAAQRHALPSSLLHAVISAESRYAPQAVSPKGAMGLMQLMPATARALGIARPFDPAQNIEGGARYLRHLLDEFAGDLSLALAAYNAGPAAVHRHGRRVPPYAETRAYVPRVLAHMARLDAATAAPATAP